MWIRPRINSAAGASGDSGNVAISRSSGGIESTPRIRADLDCR